MKTTVKAFQSVAVEVDQAAGEALMLSIVHPGKHVEERRTAFISEDAAEVLIWALEMALEARRTKRAGQTITQAERAELVAM